MVILREFLSLKSLHPAPCLANTMHGFTEVAQLLVLGFFLLLKESFCVQNYTDTWAVHIVGGEDAAKLVATRHGFDYKGQVYIIT